MKVTIKELSHAIESVLKQIADQGVDVIDIQSNCYWSIPGEHLYDMSKEPAGCTVGELIDDVDLVKSLADKSREPVRHDLVSISHVLRRIGEL